MNLDVFGILAAFRAREARIPEAASSEWFSARSVGNLVLGESRMWR